MWQNGYLSLAFFLTKEHEKRLRHIMRQSLFSRLIRLVLIPGGIRATAYWQNRATI